ncbi:hypothetical protein BN7_1910 [Wickerhamomyces ciferrii]|uniref:Uncharacterized protein n=1 Tax=Wickerhamomyces ciferrii (strain ATCC 14091 / BCRC 22168 / CBS 111 / JCM 3599 / NBRC 0793 / NRRL Y-1031 F-60-10) TaxID=1206466 RepID=K0KBG8_WICCF|nr:uncharacterized protein BN7_1910 [Wickerhamomyces ciferrii]CCH42365.1 hypothetical protein BN7_1910 [Wickerhamomyces ciferrii]
MKNFINISRLFNKANQKPTQSSAVQRSAEHLGNSSKAESQNAVKSNLKAHKNTLNRTVVNSERDHQSGIDSLNVSYTNIHDTEVQAYQKKFWLEAMYSMV